MFYALLDEEGNAVDTDSMDEEEEEEEDEELSDSENLHLEHEDADDSLQSPLEQHFEYLAEDDNDENNSEEPYRVNSSPRPEAKQKKGQSFLSRCRSSISAKFLSRSQKSQGGLAHLNLHHSKHDMYCRNSFMFFVIMDTAF